MPVSLGPLRARLDDLRARLAGLTLDRDRLAMAAAGEFEDLRREVEALAGELAAQVAKNTARLDAIEARLTAHAADNARHTGRPS